MDVVLQEWRLFVDGLTITVINPEPQPTPRQPQVSRSEWASFDTNQTENVKLNDLIAALDRLNVSAQGKINAIFKRLLDITFHLFAVYRYQISINKLLRGQ